MKANKMKNALLYFASILAGACIGYLIATSNPFTFLVLFFVIFILLIAISNADDLP